jgi:hypothetical protein
MQDRLCRTFSAALDRLEREGREPDRWEEECLSYALGALACGLYPAAEIELAAFARPAAERPAEEVALLENKPRRFTTEMLRHGLDHVMRRGVAGDDTMPLAGHLAMRSFLGASL